MAIAQHRKKELTVDITHVDNDDLLTNEEAAKELRWSEKTLDRRRWLRQPPAYIKVGRSVRYRRSVIRDFITSGEQQPHEAEVV